VQAIHLATLAKGSFSKASTISTASKTIRRAFISRTFTSSAASIREDRRRPIGIGPPRLGIEEEKLPLFQVVQIPPELRRVHPNPRRILLESNERSRFILEPGAVHQRLQRHDCFARAWPALDQVARPWKAAVGDFIEASDARAGFRDSRILGEGRFFFMGAAKGIPSPTRFAQKDNHWI
jgi:hypothetical protein